MLITGLFDSVTSYWYNAAMEKSRGYSLAELVAEGGVTPRTIRYYISEGLLPSPGAGPQARYTDEHLDRVRLIKQLQRNHLPLAEIRGQLSALGHDEVRELLATQRSDAKRKTSALEYIRSVLGGSSSGGTTPTPPPARPVAPAAAPVPARPPTPAEAAHARADLAASLHQDAEPTYRRLNRPSPAYYRAAGASVESGEPDRSHWERIRLAPDIELHLRRPLTRQHNRAVAQIVAFARQLLEEDQP